MTDCALPAPSLQALARNWPPPGRGAHLTAKRIVAIEDRLTELEIKLSLTEDLLDEVNRTVYRQQRQIEQLVVEIRALRDQLQSSNREEFRSLRDEIPPHY